MVTLPSNGVSNAFTSPPVKWDETLASPRAGTGWCAEPGSLGRREQELPAANQLQIRATSPKNFRKQECHDGLSSFSNSSSDNFICSM